MRPSKTTLAFLFAASGVLALACGQPTPAPGAVEERVDPAEALARKQAQ